MPRLTSSYPKMLVTTITISQLLENHHEWSFPMLQHYHQPFRTIMSPYLLLIFNFSNFKGFFRTISKDLFYICNQTTSTYTTYIGSLKEEKHCFPKISSHLYSMFSMELNCYTSLMHGIKLVLWSPTILSLMLFGIHDMATKKYIQTYWTRILTQILWHRSLQRVDTYGCHSAINANKSSHAI